MNGGNDLAFLYNHAAKLQLNTCRQKVSDLSFLATSACTLSCEEMKLAADRLIPFIMESQQWILHFCQDRALVRGRDRIIPNPRSHTFASFANQINFTLYTVVGILLSSMDAVNLYYVQFLKMQVNREEPLPLMDELVVVSGCAKNLTFLNDDSSVLYSLKMMKWRLHCRIPLAQLKAQLGRTSSTW